MEDVKEKVAKKVVSKKPAKKAAKKAAKSKKTGITRTRLSKSGKFKSIRHLMETLFKKSKEYPVDKAIKEVKREYPKSKFNNGHYAWYKSKIVAQGETKTR